MVPVVQTFTGRKVPSPRTHHRARPVVCATGSRRGLERLIGSRGVADEHGRAGGLGEPPSAPCVRFC